MRVQPSPPKTVLIVEDDADLLRMLSMFLRKNGFKVIGTQNGAKALELITQETVHLVITDLMMPHTDGIELTEKIHALPGLKDLPIILISGHSTEEVSEKGLRKGVALVLEKPIQLNKLLDLVGFATA